MASGDVDGKMAEWFGDLSRCLSMSLGESLVDLRAELDALTQPPSSDA